MHGVLLVAIGDKFVGEPPQDLYPVERRQHHVQHYQVEIPVERDGERFPAVGDDRAVVVLVLELEL